MTKHRAVMDLVNFSHEDVIVAWGRNEWLSSFTGMYKSSYEQYALTAEGIVISCLATDGFLVFDLLRVLLTNHVWADFDSMQVNVPSKDKKKGEKIPKCNLAAFNYLLLSLMTLIN